MMLKLKRILCLQTALTVLLVAVVAMGVILFQESAGLHQEEERLQAELGASEMRLIIIAERMSEVESQISEEIALEEFDPGEKEAIIGSLRRAMMEGVYAVDPFPSREEAIWVAGHINRQANEHNLLITRWSFSYTTTLLQERSHPGIRHSLDLDGEADSLIGFIEGLIGSPTVPVIRSMDISPHPEAGLWRIRLEMIVSFKF